MADIYIQRWSNGKRSYHLKASDSFYFTKAHYEANPQAQEKPVSLQIHRDADIQALRAITGNGIWS